VTQTDGKRAADDRAKDLLARTLMTAAFLLPQTAPIVSGPQAQITPALGPDTLPAVAASLAPQDLQKTVTVGSGDTLQDLAVQYGVSVGDIIRANPGKEAQLRAIQNANPYDPNADINHTMPGQKLNIPKPAGLWDRLTSKSDRDLNSMDEVAHHIATPELDGQAGPAAGWTEQQRLNFARVRMEMQDGKEPKDALGEEGFKHVAEHVLGDTAAEGAGIEVAGAGIFIGLGAGAAGDLLVDSFKNTLSKATDYKLAGDVEYLHQLVQSQGERALDANTLVNDPHFSGAHGLVAGVSTEEHVAAALALYQATFGNY